MRDLAENGSPFIYMRWKEKGVVKQRVRKVSESDDDDEEEEIKDEEI